jgi:pyrroline-5-carboxylate reductase
MGRALLTRWRKSVDELWVIEPSGKPVAELKATWVSDLKFLPKTVHPSIIVFAVKPQNLAGIMPAYRTRFKDKPLYISIAAGKTLGFFVTHFGKSARVVRAMPNTAALVGEAMTVLCASASVKAAAKKTAADLMSAVGEVTWVEDEGLMDAVTALSGSGPAYVFLFLECLTEAAIAAGLPAGLARQLAIQTLAGSALLAKKSPESFAALREQVVSPGGTTEAALEELMAGDLFRQLIAKTIAAAAQRSRELAQ